jgi:signal transduction histidine kinase
MKTSIQNQLMKMGMVVGGGTLLISLVVFFLHGAFSTYKALNNEITLVSQITANRLAPAILWEDKEAADKTLSDLRVKDSILIACAYTNTPSLFASYNKSKRILCPEVPPPGVNSVSYISILTELSFDNKQEGYLYIVSDTQDIVTSIAGYLIAGFFLFGTSVIVTLLLSKMFQREITMPIKALMNIMDNIIRSGNFTKRGTKYHDDEIGVLTDEFNTMLDEIEARDVELKTMNANLEKTVEDRTRDLRFTIEKLEKANKDKELWVSNMTHELRTPAHHMKSFAKLGISRVDEAISTGEPVDHTIMRQFFDRCLTAANRMHTLVEGVLSLGKLNSGEVRLNYEHCELPELIETVKQELSLDIEAKHLILRIVNHASQTSVICDQAKIIQVITNVLKNAIKFSPNGETITITLRDVTGYAFKDTFPAIQIDIKDHGMGIPEGEEDDIFNAFTQSTKTFDGSGGTGLGLSISKQIVQAHEGKISAQNNPVPEPGCTFSFYIAKTPLAMREKKAS